MSSSLTSTSAVTPGEQRPRAGVGQRRGGDAADLQPSRDVGQQLGLGRSVLGAHTAGRGLGGDHPFGHDQLGQPATQLPALAGAGRRQRSGQRAAAQSRLARVDLVDRHRDTARPRDDAARDAEPIGPLIARSPSPQGEYTSRPAQPTRTSAHHWPGSTQAGGVTSKPSSTVPRAGNTAPSVGRADPLPRPPRADQVRLQAQVGTRVGADGDGQPSRIARRPPRHRPAPRSGRPDRRHPPRRHRPRDVFDHLTPGGRDVGGPVTCSCARTG